jgi:hypothetical protein
LVVADVVVAGKPLVRAERLSLDRDQRVRIDVLARHVPARREAGLVERDRPRGVGDDLRAVLDDEVA